MKRFLVGALLGALAFSAAGCVFHFVQVQKLVPSDAVVVTSPVKAHLKDGSTVVYAKGVTVSGGTLLGAGARYDLALKQSSNVNTIPLNSVVGMESFQTHVNGVKTAIVTTLVTAGAVVGSVALFKAIFGSCPTVYSDNGTVQEAELFSNSIAPLFEARDVDRLHAQPGPNGILHLELRNEAMETHYINHLQIFEVPHAADEVVVPVTTITVARLSEQAGMNVMRVYHGNESLPGFKALVLLELFFHSLVQICLGAMFTGSFVSGSPRSRSGAPRTSASRTWTWGCPLLCLLIPWGLRTGCRGIPAPESTGCRRAYLTERHYYHHH